MWIDFADGSVPFWTLFAKPGIIAAAAQLIYPPQLRAGGAQTVYFDLYLRNRVGTTTTPADPAVVVERANKFFDYAVQSTGCATPFAAFNELQGPSLDPPWSVTNARYRQNVLVFLKTFAERGGRPFLLLPSRPSMLGEAADWWREVAKHADIVREVYFPAPRLSAQGPVLATRNLRQVFRRSIADFLAIGIPPKKLGLMLGFQTTPGTGGREQLETAKWFETVKWQTVAAAQVSGELRIASVWSWGWGAWSDTARDGDKMHAACVMLWTRNPALCNAPGVIGKSFNTSLKEARLVMPSGVQCTLGAHAIRSRAIGQLSAVTGDREVAFSALYARAVESGVHPIPTGRILAAERSIIAFRFGGSAAAYRTALAARRATVAVARGVIADELRRIEIRQRLRVPSATGGAVESFYSAYSNVLTREVEAAPAPTWLGFRTRGRTLASLAPPQVFKLRTGARRTISWAGESYDVRVLAPAIALGALPLEVARPAIAAGLASFERTTAFHAWTAARQEAALRRLACRRDALPQPADVELAEYLPFLALS